MPEPTSTADPHAIIARLTDEERLIVAISYGRRMIQDGIELAMEAKGIFSYAEVESGYANDALRRVAEVLEHNYRVTFTRRDAEPVDSSVVKQSFTPANYEAGIRELRSYVEAAGFKWCEEESVVFNVTTALGWLSGALETANKKLAAPVQPPQQPPAPREIFPRQANGEICDSFIDALNDALGGGFGFTQLTLFLITAESELARWNETGEASNGNK